MIKKNSLVERIANKIVYEKQNKTETRTRFKEKF
jgi:hypothetical protein